MCHFARQYNKEGSEEGVISPDNNREGSEEGVISPDNIIRREVKRVSFRQTI